MSELSEHLISDILSRLPVKCLVRFKCVSKAWYSLISDPQFAKMHLKRTNHHRILLFTRPFLSIDPESYLGDGDDNLVTTQFSFPNQRNLESDYNIMGSCHGLVCAVFDFQNHIIVFNPSTRDSKELPPLPNNSILPEASNFFCGFGYDNRLDDYKIVRGCCSTSAFSNHIAKIEVLALKSNMWRTIEGLNCNVLFKGSGTFSNGFLHWLAERQDVPNRTYVMVSFDLAEERFLELAPLPDMIDHSFLCSKLKVLRDDNLCVYTTFYGAIYKSYFEVWIMKEGCNWSRLSRFSSDELPGCKYWLDLLYVTNNGYVVMDLDGWVIVLYNPREDTFERFTIQHDWDWFTTTTYIESLVSPNSR